MGAPAVIYVLLSARDNTRGGPFRPTPCCGGPPIATDLTRGPTLPFSLQAYVDYAGRPFAVGEYWHGETRALVNYVRAAGGSLAAFDFALYYHLQRAVESGDFGILNAYGNLNGLVGIGLGSHDSP
ncbi:hypothetical protein Emag_005311 [Eimeria magna]